MTWERRSTAYDRRPEADRVRSSPTLLHHIYAVDRLRAAYLALERKAAAGVDGETWQSYGQDLEAQPSGPVRPAGPRGATGPSL